MMIKIKELRRELRDRANLVTIIILVLIALGYLFFFTSKLWHSKEYIGVKALEIGETHYAKELGITLASFDYGKDEKIARVMLEVEDFSLNHKSGYTLEVREVGGKIGYDVVIDRHGFMVLEIPLSRDFTEVSIKFKDKKTDEYIDEGKIFLSHKLANDVSSLEKLGNGQDGFIKAKQKANFDVISHMKNAIKKEEDEIGKLEKDISESTQKARSLEKELDAAAGSKREKVANALSNLKSDIDEDNRKIGEIKRQIEEQKKIIEERKKML